MKRFIRKLLAILSAPIRECIRHELIKQEQRCAHRYVFRSNIEMELKKRATSTSTDYVLQHMDGVFSAGSATEILTFALSEAKLQDSGLICEFGVYKGTSINHIGSSTKKTVFGFDSFEGLPESWYGKYHKGHFAMDKLPEVRPNVKLIKGWFSETLPRFVLEYPEPLIFLHVDCDLYSSTKSIFEHMGSRIKPGCVILFDEYFNYPGWQVGEYKAFQEFISVTGLRYKYLAYSRLHEQVAVKIID